MRTPVLDRYVEPATTRPTVVKFSLPSGYRGTAKTVDRIVSLVRAGAKDFYVRQKAIDIIFEHKVLARDFLGEIKALFEWVQANVRYVKDPVRVELLHTARRMLQLRAGDCDDMTITLGALLEAVGHPVRLVLTGRDRRRPRSFSHIYLQVHLNGRWISLDPTVPYPMGWAGRAPARAVVSIHRARRMSVA